MRDACKVGPAPPECYTVTVTAISIRTRKLAVISVEREGISEARHAAVEQLDSELGAGLWRVVCRDEAPLLPAPADTHWNARRSNIKL